MPISNINNGDSGLTVRTILNSLIGEHNTVFSNYQGKITVVANYSALPAANTVSGKFYWVSASQGTKWLPGSLGGTFYNKGLYYSNGTSWEYIDTPYQATQTEVNAGIVTDKFVTPETLENSTMYLTKLIDNSLWKVLNASNVQNTLDQIDEEILESRNTGLIHGGGITVTGANSVSIAAGKGEILNSTNPASLDYDSVVWGLTAITGLPSGLSYIYVNASGTVTYTTTKPSHVDYREKIWLYRISISGGTITGVNSIANPILQNTSGIHDIFTSLGLIKRDLVVSANGANLKINISAGEIYQVGINFYNDNQNPHEVTFTATNPQTFRMVTSASTIATDVTDLPVGSYDVGGVVTAIPGASSRTSIFTVYKFTGGNVRILYGNAWYNSITEAYTALGSYYPVAPNGYEEAIIIGYIIAQKGATTLNNATQARFVLTNKFGGIGGALSANFSNFLQIANDLSDLNNAATARTNLGLGNVDNTSDATKNSATATLTNKRITKRVGSTTSSATPTINTDNYDIYKLTAQAADITSFTTNLSGTPTDGQLLWIQITDNGSARAITWGASFESSTATLPTTTVASTRLDVGLVWNTATSKWRCIAVA